MARGGRGRGRSGGDDTADSSRARAPGQRGGGRTNSRNAASFRGRASGGRQNTSAQSHAFGMSSASVQETRDGPEDMKTRLDELRAKRELERAKAIKDGLLADQYEKRSLADAITPVGTCTDMCAEFERVERLVTHMADRAEKIHTATGDRPVEQKMIKRFRRSAAGDEEQLPSDIRTPKTLQKTLDYLLNEVVGGGERLSSIHKFVWDRTRAIRNDFSIQQVTKGADVRIAVDCFERIARFHVLSLHQLSNPENLGDDFFEPQQEREQLNNTIISLISYYSDHNEQIVFPNEAEFRAYCILFELHAQQPDLEDRMQSWRKVVLKHPRTITALKLYTAAGNTLFEKGPLKPMEAFDVAQGNAVAFWTLLRSREVPYLMACVAELNFAPIRFAALQALWKSVKRAPNNIQAKTQDWTTEEIAKLLGFDDQDEALEFCERFSLGFQVNDNGQKYLNFTSQQGTTLDRSSTPDQQTFSFNIVEQKRHRRTLSAVVNGVSVAEAIKSGQVVEGGTQDAGSEDQEPESLFLNSTGSNDMAPSNPNPFGFLNKPAVSTATESPFAKAASFSSSAINPLAVKDGPSIFGQQSTEKASPISNPVKNPFSSSSLLNPSAGAFASPPSTSSFGKSSPFSPNPLSSSTSPTPTPSVFGFGAKSAPSSAEPSTGSCPNPQESSAKFSGLFGSNPQPSGSSSTSAFGLPSVKPSAPTSTTPFNAPASANTNKPQTTFNFSSNQSLSESDTPLFPTLTADSSSSSSTQEVPGVSSSNPPEPPRPGSLSLPAEISQTSPTSLFPSLTPEPPSESSQNQNSKPLFSFLQSAQTKVNTPPTAESPKSSVQFGLFPNPLSTPATSVQQSFVGGTSSTHSALPSESPAIQPTKADPPPVAPFVFGSNSKSALPSTVTPQPKTTSFFPPSASTVPKHKSPLGLQTPLTASDSSPAKPSIKTKPTPDASKAALNLATISFLEPHGILQQFVEHFASSIVEDAVRQFQEEKEIKTIHRARVYLLSRKFYQRWRKNYWHNKIHRGAESRRKMFARSIRRENEKVLAKQAETEAILRAQKEEQRKEKPQSRIESEKKKAQSQVAVVSNGGEKVPAVGQKRKSVHVQNGMSPPTNIPSRKPVINGHKRSRTVNDLNVNETVKSHDSAGIMSSRFQSKFSRSSGASKLMASPSSSLNRSPSTGGKTDSTRTDYFRLKAMGVDPETPLFPDTKSSLERKRRSIEGLASYSPRKRVHTSPPAEPTVPEQEKPSWQKRGVKYDDDEFLSQIRQVRQAMSQDADWFKIEAEKMQKEIEEQEELQKSSLRSSRQSSELAGSHSSSFMASVNGYDYVPMISKSTSTPSLSRTEQRIRATGAHGFATRSVSEYLPVALSKSSRDRSRKAPTARINGGKGGNKKRKTGDGDRNYVYSSDEDESEESVFGNGENLHGHRQDRDLVSSVESLERDNISTSRARAGHPSGEEAQPSSPVNGVYGIPDENGEGEVFEPDATFEDYHMTAPLRTFEDDEASDEADSEDDDDSEDDAQQVQPTGLVSAALESIDRLKSSPAPGWNKAPEPSSGLYPALPVSQVDGGPSGAGGSADDAFVLSD